MASSSEQAVALQPPPGQVSNLINPKSYGNWDIVCVAVCLSTTTTAFFLRSYVRLWKKREWIVEDYMCCLSWALLISFCATSIVLMKDHGDIHEWNLTKAQARKIIRTYNIGTIVYGPAMGCTKVSILLLYRRIFSPQKKTRLGRAIPLFIWILVLFYIVITFLKIFQCTPRARIWNKNEPGTCLNLGNVLTASGVFNTLTDVLLYVIPVRVSWTLNTSTKRKIGVVVLFTFGFLGPVFGIIGLAVRITTLRSPDVTYAEPKILLWAAAEITTGLICVCVPPIAALAHPHQRLRPKVHFNVRSSSTRRRSDGSRPHRADTFDDDDIYPSSDLELHFNGAAPGVTIPPPLVTTNIFTDTNACERRTERRGYITRRQALWEKLDDSSRAMGVTTTIRSERYHV